MLYLPPSTSRLIRAQGALVTDDEIRRLVDFVSAQSAPAFELAIHERMASERLATTNDDVTRRRRGAGREMSRDHPPGKEALPLRSCSAACASATPGLRGSLIFWSSAAYWAPAKARSRARFSSISTPPSDPAHSDMEPLGKKLQQARLAKKISLEEAARVTKIRAARIQEIEAEDFSNFPSLAYAKGFLLIYGKFLDVDVTPYLDAFATSQEVRSMVTPTCRIHRASPVAPIVRRKSSGKTPYASSLYHCGGRVRAWPVSGLNCDSTFNASHRSRTSRKRAQLPPQAVAAFHNRPPKSHAPRARPVATAPASEGHVTIAPTPETRGPTLPRDTEPEPKSAEPNRFIPKICCA